MEKLADGRTAEIFARDEKYVLKLYRPGWAQRDAEFEFKMVQQIQQTDIPTPAAIELVTVDGRPGIIFERVHGQTFLAHLWRDPGQLVSLSQQLAELHAAMHHLSANSLRDNRDRLRRKINRARPLPQHMKTAVLQQLTQLPHENKLLHGDFHFDNVLLTDDGPVIIDWIDASHGHPLADVARTLIIMSYGRPPDADETLVQQIQQMRQLFASVYLERYGALRPDTLANLEAWKAPVAAGRLSENIPEIEADLLALVQNITHLG